MRSDLNRVCDLALAHNGVTLKIDGPRAFVGKLFGNPTSITPTKDESIDPERPSVKERAGMRHPSPGLLLMRPPEILDYFNADPFEPFKLVYGSGYQVPIDHQGCFELAHWAEGGVYRHDDTTTVIAFRFVFDVITRADDERTTSLLRRLLQIVSPPAWEAAKITLKNGTVLIERAPGISFSSLRDEQICFGLDARNHWQWIAVLDIQSVEAVNPQEYRRLVRSRD